MITIKKRTAAFLAAVLLLAGCGSSSTTGHFSRSDLQRILAQRWQDYSRNRTNFGGGLAMQILSPSGDYFISTGMGPDMASDWHFRTASCTKTFTAAAIMLLNQRGKLRIDDRITDPIPGTAIPYVPATEGFDIPYKSQISIRLLLMHRAGVFDVTNDVLPDSVPAPYRGRTYPDYVVEADPDHQFTLDELIGINAMYQLSYFAPDTAYHYSNTGYSILGKIIERVSGKSYACFIRDELLAPNGLSGSSVPVNAFDQLLPMPFISGYAWDGNELIDVTKSNMSVNIAEGNVITTPIDLATWCCRLLRGEAGPDAQAVEMMKTGLPGPTESGSTYGLGILQSPKLGYGHSGAHAGYLTLMYHYPDLNVTYVLFTNVWDLSNGKTSLGEQITAMGEMARAVLSRMGY